jgi:hypothetical protein
MCGSNGLCDLWFRWAWFCVRVFPGLLHCLLLVFLQEWLRISRVELDRNPPLCRELRDFLVKVSSCGTPYQQWCTELRQEFPALVSCSVSASHFLKWRNSELGISYSLQWSDLHCWSSTFHRGSIFSFRKHVQSNLMLTIFPSGETARRFAAVSNAKG